MLLHARELNAFAVGEANARSVGVNVRQVRLSMLICASVLIGVSVSIGGTIAFVGLVTPHILRLITGPNHKKLLPASAVWRRDFPDDCRSAGAHRVKPRGTAHRRGDLADRRGGVRADSAARAARGMRMLEVKHLIGAIRRYAGAAGRFPACRQSGEWVMITGPNGAGKSTLLEALMQSVPYTGGASAGRRRRENPEAPRTRAPDGDAVPAGFAGATPLPWKKSCGWAGMPGTTRWAGLSAADEAAVEHAMCSTGTAALRHKPISQISGGEVQRAFLAQLFAQNPRFCCWTNRLSHLDLVLSEADLRTDRQSWLRQEGRAPCFPWCTIYAGPAVRHAGHPVGSRPRRGGRRRRKTRSRPDVARARVRHGRGGLDA